MTPAFAYIRTSSATNVGTDKDSEKRQIEIIAAFAKASGFELVGTYYDAAVKGADLIDARPAFSEMLQRMLANGVKSVIVETASRFARDLIVQETGYRMLRDKGITIVPADAPDYFTEETPTTTLIRQVLGAVSQFEKAMLVNKLRGARERKRALTGKCEGRRGYRETNPAMVGLARRLRSEGYTLRSISKELAVLGFLNQNQRPFAAASIKQMLT